jgi:beta-galactosidase
MTVCSTLAWAAPSPRVRYTINEQWRYAPGSIDGAAAADFDDSAWQAVNVPHTWNAVDAFDKTATYRRGVGWYRKRLRLDPALRGKRLFLYFEGANQVADVFVNGRHVGRHLGGYTAFVFEITDLVTFDRHNVIAVRVDNSHNPDIPPLNADFTFYGGIYRDVWLLATSAIHLDTDHASPGVFISTQENVVRIVGTVVNQSEHDATLRIVNRIIDATGAVVTSLASNVRVSARASSSFDQRSSPIEALHLWSPATPYLYRVRTEVYGDRELVDAVENPLGFRSFSVDAQNGLILNAQPLKLFGTNRHQDYAGLGNALPDDLHRRDIRLIKETGFNFLRLAHYPQDPSVLDEADRAGLVIWEEIPIVNLISTSAAFAENSERMLVEMIRQHYNHPSILFWGYMNEVMLRKPDPVPERYYEILSKLAQRLDKRAHAEDSTRRTVMALSRDELIDDKGLADIPDILGMNLYFGWYYENFAALGEFLDRIHQQRPARPLIVSEYGAGTDERVHAMQPKRFDFSSEYGQEFHRASFPQLERRPFVLGTAVWNQFDFGSASRQDTKYSINSKGLFFYDRKPKDMAFYYQAALLAKPLLTIAREWSERAGDRLQPIWVYTNQEEVELFVNGRSAGSRAVENRTARWQVELLAGENRIRARAGSLEDTTMILYDDRAGGTFVAVNAGGGYAYFDASHVYWEADRGYAGGEEKRTYHRIFGTNEDPLYQSSREGMDRYQFDVPDGIYEVRLRFAEGNADAKRGDRVFSVRVNGREVIHDLDLFAEYGTFTAVSRSFCVEATNGTGIAIEFTASAGKASVAAIMVRR